MGRNFFYSFILAVLFFAIVPLSAMDEVKYKLEGKDAWREEFLSVEFLRKDLNERLQWEEQQAFDLLCTPLAKFFVAGKFVDNAYDIVNVFWNCRFDALKRDKDPNSVFGDAYIRPAYTERWRRMLNFSKELWRPEWEGMELLGQIITKP